MTSPRRVVDLVVRCCPTPAVQALMTPGGIDIHRAVRPEQCPPVEPGPGRQPDFGCCDAV
jgi:hypothetical protein